MFGWLTRIFSRPLVPVDADIFTYYNGRRWVKGDGLQIMRDLALSEGMDDISLKTADIPTVEGVKALDKVIAAARRAFKLKQLAAGGVSDGRVKQIVLEFFAWHDTVKKNSSSSQILPAGPVFQEDLLPEQSPLSSTSIVIDQKPDSPMPSVVESDLPSESVPTG